MIYLNDILLYLHVLSFEPQGCFYQRAGTKLNIHHTVCVCFLCVCVFFGVHECLGAGVFVYVFLYCACACMLVCFKKLKHMKDVTE